jgi:hypothetical protein
MDPSHSNADPGGERVYRLEEGQNMDSLALADNILLTAR